MKPILFLAALLLMVSPLVGQERSTAEVVRAAVSPLPADLKADAGVLVETEDGKFSELRPSGNGMSCVLRQPPDREEPFLDSRCYSDRFWPAVLHLWTMDPAPGSFAESYERMHRDIEAGLVQVPDEPTAGYRVFGPLSAFDFATGEVGPGIQKWQSVHFPFRTSAELGLTETREGSREDLPGLMPFVMASGTWWSHVMIMHEPWPW